MAQVDVLIIGRTPVGSMLARIVAGGDKSVALIDDEMTPNTTGTARWKTLRALGVSDHPVLARWPTIASLAERILVDAGSLDARYQSDRLNDRANRYLLTESLQLVELIVGGVDIDHETASPISFLWHGGTVSGVRFVDGREIGARLTLVTSANRLLLGVSDCPISDQTATPVFERIEISWPFSSDSKCGRINIRGGVLAEVDGVATILLSADRLVLSLTVPVASLVREAIVITDLLNRLLCHPGFADVPAVSASNAASVKLLTLPERVNLARFGSGNAVLGAMEGLCDPTSFDRELLLAQAIGQELKLASADCVGSVALLGAISAIVGSMEAARRSPRVAGTQANVDWILEDLDRLGTALGQMARLSPVP